MRVMALALACAASTLIGEPVAAQTANSLVGSWVRVQQRDSNGAIIRPAPPTAFLVFTPDGYYSQTAIPRDRPKTSRPLAQLTIKELLARFEYAEARYGRYTVTGNRLSRTTIASLEPNNEGGPAQVQVFRIQGNVLILRSLSAGDKAETRFRRAK